VGPPANARRVPFSIARLLATGLLISIGPAPVPAQTTDAYFEFLIARRLESAGDYQGALAALQRAAAADPRSAEVRAEIASLHYRQNLRQEAEQAAKAALAVDEKNAEANRVLGLIYMQASEGNTRAPAQAAAAVRDAITHLERAVAGGTFPDPALHTYLGRLYIRSGEPEKAVQALTKALAANPGFLPTRLTLAEAYAEAKDLRGAIDTLEEVVADEPQVASALAQYQERAGLLREAVDSYTLALSLQPRGQPSRNLKFRRIAVLYTLKEYRRAAAFAAEAREQHPEDLRFPRLEARALFDAGDRTAGLAMMEAVVKAAPRDIQTLFSMVDLYADAGEAESTERVLRQILAIEAGNPNALNYLGYLLATRGERLDEAIALVRRALDADPDNGAYLDSLGWAHFKRGDLDEAQKYLEAAAARLPENSEIQDHLGDMHARRGRLQEAIVAWMRALDGDGQDVDKAVIQGKIDEARRKAK
jgi:tetratricopeptide (TPR) repeat protein